MYKCPDCNREGKIIGLGCNEKECKVVVMRCPRCKGAGEIPDVMVKWITLGEKLRNKRRKQKKGLRTKAKELGILASKLSQAENGYINPKDVQWS